MENKTIGKFISALRRANGMTQKELGEKLFVSDKTVSRWERDECTPELSLIPSIAEIFGITTDELLRGEKNNPEREIVVSQETISKQKSKSDKQFKLMLHNGKKKFSNLSIISVGLSLAGIIVAAICYIGFGQGLLGFGLASILFIASVICQICFTTNFSFLVDDEDAEHEECTKKANTEMVLASVKIFLAIFLIIVFCLPLAIIDLSYFNYNHNINVDYWLVFGAAFVAVAFLLSFIIYRLIIVKVFIDKEVVYFAPSEIEASKADTKHLGIVLLVYISVVIALVLSYLTVIGFLEMKHKNDHEVFYSSEDYVMYVQDQYRQWLKENGYGIAEDSDITYDSDIGYPSIGWGYIDGYSYYYCTQLVNEVTYENGIIKLETTDMDVQHESERQVITNVFITLQVINLLSATAWYCIGSKKHVKKASY